MNRIALLLVLVGGVAAASRVSSAPHPAAQTTWDSVYSANQAARGESSYAKACARCHGAALGGGDQAPPLAGSAFLGNWNGTTLADLQTRIVTTMPSDSIGVYKRDVVTDVMAFMLKANGFPAGANDLAVDSVALKSIELRTSR
jgi:mono/diheme cytochrome c family protein